MKFKENYSKRAKFTKILKQDTSEINKLFDKKVKKRQNFLKTLK